MLFSSVPFLFYFLPAALLIYFAAPRQLKNAVLLLASLFFYAWGEQITEEIIDYIAYALEKGCSMTGPEDPGIERLNVLK